MATEGADGNVSPAVSTFPVPVQRHLPVLTVDTGSIGVRNVGNKAISMNVPSVDFGGHKMSKVAAEIKVMPTGPEVDLDALQERLEGSLPEGVKITGFDREDVAFGLTALVPTVVVPDDAGGTDAVEDAFGAVADVESVSIGTVTRV